MSVAKGFTLIELLVSTLLASLITIMITHLSGASLSVFIKSYLLESHIGELNAILFSVRQQISNAVLDEDSEGEIIYIEANRDGVDNACIRFIYTGDGELIKTGYRLDSENKVIERYSQYADNWSCSDGYWQDLHDSHFEIELFNLSYQAPILVLELKIYDTYMDNEEYFYVSAYIEP